MNNTIRAALWMIGAITSFTLMAIAGREVSNELDTFEIMLFRSLTGIAIILTIITLRKSWGQIATQRIRLHIVRNLCHFTGQNLWFYAIALIPLAQVFALEFTTPIWVILLSPLILQEKLSKVGIISASIGFVGILIVTRPEASTFNIGVGAAALCAIFFALTAIFTKKLTQTETITCILTYLTITQAIFGLIGAGYDGDITLPSATALPWVIGIGFAGLMAHFCLTSALSLAPASIVMPMDFVRLPAIALVGAVFYNEPLDAAIFIGAALIFGANYLNISQQKSR